MNNNIDAPVDGKILKMKCKPGRNLDKGDIICIIEPT
jgi:biotin carboxyl carrier protein